MTVDMFNCRCNKIPWHRLLFMKRIGQKGFTLIEIIVSLVLVGIMATTAGIGIVTFVKAQSFTMINAALTQKAELALSRITWEFMDFTDVLSVNAEGNYISYHMIAGDRALVLDTADNQLKMTEGATTLAEGFALIDNVQSFTMTLWTLINRDGILTKEPWTVDDPTIPKPKLYGIDIEMKIIHPDEDVGALTFTTSVAPRNNG